MPTNLPPECADAERRYREAKAPEEKARYLEDYIGVIPKHKGTDKLRASLRKRLSKLKRAAEQAKKKSSKHESEFLIDKEGAGQVAVIGPPNVGKSALVAYVTHAHPEVGKFPFTTWRPIPGMMPFEDIQIQLLDTPPLNHEHMESDLLDLIRRADLLLLVVDVQGAPVDQLEECVGLLEEHRIVPLRLKERYEEQQRVTFRPCLLLLNKDDSEEHDENVDIFRELVQDDWPLVSASATTGRHLDLLKKELFERLEIIRVYSKAPGKKAEFSDPFVLKQGSTVEEFAAKVHHDFVERLKLAKVWGHGVYDGQAVHRDHVLSDKDVVELHM